MHSGGRQQLYFQVTNGLSKGGTNQQWDYGGCFDNKKISVYLVAGVFSFFSSMRLKITGFESVHQTQRMLKINGK